MGTAFFSVRVILAVGRMLFPSTGTALIWTRFSVLRVFLTYMICLTAQATWRLRNKNRNNLRHLIDPRERFAYTEPMTNSRIRKDDQAVVMREIGPLLPAMLREAVDEGFHNYVASRRKDPDAYPEYSDCTRANMLYDRVAASARQLINAMAADVPDLSWKISHNKRATDIFLDTRFAFRIKRTKLNRHGLTTSVSTNRQRAIKSEVMLPVGQMVLPFPDNPTAVADEERIWLTVGFDLDDLEEFLERVSLGIELRKKFLWKIPLPVPDANVIATLSPVLADKIVDMRLRRSA